MLLTSSLGTSGSSSGTWLSDPEDKGRDREGSELHDRGRVGVGRGKGIWSDPHIEGRRGDFGGGGGTKQAPGERYLFSLCVGLVVGTESCVDLDERLLMLVFLQATGRGSEKFRNNPAAVGASCGRTKRGLGVGDPLFGITKGGSDARRERPCV